MLEDSTRQRIESSNVPASIPAQGRAQDQSLATCPHFYDNMTAEKQRESCPGEAQDYQQLHLTCQEPPSARQQQEALAAEIQNLDLFYPFSNLDMLDIIPADEATALTQFQTDPFDPSYFEIDDWNSGCTITTSPSTSQSVGTQFL